MMLEVNRVVVLKRGVDEGGGNADTEGRVTAARLL